MVKTADPRASRRSQDPGKGNAPHRGEPRGGAFSGL